uniref:Outer membrane protein assembly factor BamA n=1 Tax=Eiseniibacteriota bacterium TaxID=2212470 RepID=A0A832MJH6_UNCEI
MLFGTPAAAQPLASAPSDSAAAPAAAAPVVGRVSVAGNVAVDSARILRTFEVAPGARYSEDAVRRGFRKLFALGLFTDIQVDRIERPGGVLDLVVRVRERPRIERIEFAGNRKRETAELEKKLFLRPGATYAPTAVTAQTDSLLRYYREEGFARASVRAEADTAAGGGQVVLRFVIAEGERVRIERVAFEGATAFPEKRLRKALKTKARGFFGGGDVREEQLAEDREKLERHYRSRGYRDMRWLGHRFEAGSRPDRTVLVVTVDEGPRYRFGEVTWTGNRVVATEALQRLWPRARSDLYDVSRIERAQGGAYAEYAEKGYLYLTVEPRETVRDSLVDLTFAVAEGRPSHVRYVVISGNRGTREKVIRREVDLREGDLFRRSALVRTQGDIMRLGLFEDVQVDFTPAESTDVDIVLKVKEKQVGTASAGAGYTNEAGLTGFLEIGHNNVLGNGQSIQLHLERGSRREDYYVSFTEPWFRDTPTLLGFTAFNSTRDRDLYEEKRVGGSGRIGRPLPWPDYSRGSVSYRLEEVTLSRRGTTLSVEDSIALSGIVEGEGILTSSVDVSFLRNSTDNPFYPTKGTRLSATSELAGGPFGGSVDFNKHRVEGRLYVPSIVKGVTTMLRARWGVLSGYTGQTRPVPAYERFRLGGGTTPDPLRGYDDYQVVPEKFVQDIVRPRTQTRFDSSGAAIGVDTVGTTTIRVRYPGGRFMTLYTLEQQFPIVHPLHGVIFLDAGNTWDLPRDIRPFDLKLGAGAGLRMEIPLLGNIGFDWGYGFDRDDGPRAVGHFLLGNVNF